MGSVFIDSINLVQDRYRWHAGSCEHGTSHPGPMKCQFVDWVDNIERFRGSAA